jgi:phosphoribosylaminoimidazolecarboxamide formyltransferase/IMP cyclohydrolase
VSVLEKIKRAIISVYQKEGLEDLASALEEKGISIISSGGTFDALQKAGIKAQKITELTKFPEILDGRVKTLHPTVFGAILAKRKSEHLKQLQEQQIDPIDLVIVNLYPFESTIAKPDCTMDHAIEQIDIGGPSLIRAAAKNFNYITVITSPEQYQALLQELDQNNGCTSQEFRQNCAITAFRLVARYNTIIAEYFQSLQVQPDDFPALFTFQGRKIQDLRYGENPHQKAAFYSCTMDNPLNNFNKLHGKELSYNNILDLNAALNIIKDFREPAVVIIKHNNPCGAGRSDKLINAYQLALDTDSLSAFGGIVGLTGKVDTDLAELLAKHFFECILAAEFSSSALEILRKKKNLRLISYDKNYKEKYNVNIRTVCDGLVIQSKDNLRFDIRKGEVVSKRPPAEHEWRALEFAWRLVKHVRSNAIVFTNENQLIGVGAGQMSRVDSTELAIHKAKKSGHLTEKTVVASDAFFPFRDGIDVLSQAGATAVIQPGGSVRDEEVIEAANEKNLAMIFTGNRHFKH